MSSLQLVRGFVDGDDCCANSDSNCVSLGMVMAMQGVNAEMRALRVLSDPLLNSHFTDIDDALTSYFLHLERACKGMS